MTLKSWAESMKFWEARYDMGATFGEKLKVTIFGESHGTAIGVVIDGLPAGFKPDFAAVDEMMARRSAKGKEKIATARREGD